MAKRSVQAYIEEVPCWKAEQGSPARPFLGCSGWCGHWQPLENFLKA